MSEDKSFNPAEAFYAQTIDILTANEIEFLVGGAFALRGYTGIIRDTKDFDIMVRPGDVERLMSLCQRHGLNCRYTFPHWLAKIHHEDHFIDIIFRAGNGLCEVDDLWFDHAETQEIFGRSLKICPAEEIIWQKAYIMERERFDGADIQHLLQACAEKLDWQRLLIRFGDDWRVLFSHLVMFGFIYPGESRRLPTDVLNNLLHRFSKEETKGNEVKQDARLCQGTLVSRAQYLFDIKTLGYQDARLVQPRIKMTVDDVHNWTEAIEEAQGKP